jgi:ADP-ribosylglycohydrolase
MDNKNDRGLGSATSTAFEAYRQELRRIEEIEELDASYFPETGTVTVVPREVIEAHALSTAGESTYDRAAIEALESPIDSRKAGAKEVPKEEKLLGTLLGSACGDALAAPVEFLSFEAIAERFPPAGPRDLSDDLFQVTDDTQMALAVGRALVAAEKNIDDPERVSKALVQEFIVWLRDPENDRAPGNTCLSACAALERGEPWHAATRMESKGCGANMRVTPVAMRLWRPEDRIQRSRVAQLQAAITHGHPTALAASDVTAYVIALIIQGCDPDAVLAEARSYCLPENRPSYHQDWLGSLWKQSGASSPEDYMSIGWEETDAALARVQSALALGDRYADPCVLCGAGWIAEEALATALYCFLLHFWENPVYVFRRAAFTSGDSDSIACLAGAFAGAFGGIMSLPTEWIDVIEYRDELAQTANVLATHAGVAG